LESLSAKRLQRKNITAEVNNEVRLAIGIPLSWPFCHSDFFDSFTMLRKPVGTEIIRAQSGPIQEMRNTIAMQALAKECTHLLFLDADMVYPENTIESLLAVGKRLVGGLTFKRWPPFNPILYIGEPYETTFLEDVPEGIVQVTSTGTGCLMIDCTVFDEIEYPWFEFDKTKENHPVGEDINFCYKAGEKGIKIYVDCDVKTEHLTQVRVNESLWYLNRKLMKQGLRGFGF
jgi:GT2 family glycosyltransferase